MRRQDAQQGLVKRQFGHRARLALDPGQATVLDAQAHAARTTWNLLHDWWLMLPKAKRTLVAADVVIRQGRKELAWLGVLPRAGRPGSTEVLLPGVEELLGETGAGAGVQGPVPHEDEHRHPPGP